MSSEQPASGETYVDIDTLQTDNDGVLVLPPEREHSFSVSRVAGALIGRNVEEMTPLEIDSGVFQIHLEESRDVFLGSKERVQLFERMRTWKSQKPNDTVWQMIDAFEKEKEDGADAYAKVLYDYPFPDFILKYENCSDEKDTKDLAKERNRRNFEKLLILAGAVIEHEPDIDTDCTYVKIYIPFMRMCQEAEYMNIKMWLDVSHLPKVEIRSGIFERLGFITKRFIRQIDLNKQSAFFKKARLRQFDRAELDRPWSDIVKDFWDGAKRSLLTHHIIINCNEIHKETEVSGKRLQSKQRIRFLSIKRLLADNVYCEFFPLHDGPLKAESPRNLRAELHELWFTQWRKPQPLEQIRQYFGEKLAIYFAFLGFYTLWLNVASILGVLVIIFGIIETSRGNDEMGIDRASRLWDNALTAPFAFLMSVWATCFLETWKRYNVSLQYDWDVLEFEKEEQPRPEFHGTTIRRSPITHKKELHVPYGQRLKKLLVSGGVVFIAICIVTVTIGVLLTYSRQLLGSGVKGNVASACLNLATIMVLNAIYSKCAVWLTDFENNKTATRYEDSLILKTFCFDFVNYYSALFFIMLFKEKVAAWFDNDNFKCQYDGNCFAELMVQLAIILIGKQAIGQFQELFIPWIKSKLRKQVLVQQLHELQEKYKSSSKRMLDDIPQWARDDKLAQLHKDQRSEYEEMVVQFGFISLFAVAFPLAPLFAWLNNITEIRFDAMKYLKTCQRAVGFQAQDIGTWEMLMNGVSLLAVLTNAGIIAFHSKWLETELKRRSSIDVPNNSDSEVLQDLQDKDLLEKRLLFMFIFEHSVLLIKLCFAYLIADVPKPVRVAIERERYMARLALEDDDPEPDDIPEEEGGVEELFNLHGSLRFRKLKEQSDKVGHELKHESEALVDTLKQQDASSVKQKVKEETSHLAQQMKEGSQKMLGQFSWQRHNNEESIDKPKET